jgi:hypothetical protein
MVLLKADKMVLKENNACSIQTKKLRTKVIDQKLK